MAPEAPSSHSGPPRRLAPAHLTRPPQAVKAARRRRQAWGALALAVGAAALLWQLGWPQRGAGGPVKFQGAWVPGVLSAILPGWPQRAPWLLTPTQRVKATQARILNTEAMGGEWAVAYLLEGPLDAHGGRVAVPGMGIVAPLERGADGQPRWALRLGSQGLGGWSEEGAYAFEGVDLAEAQLQTVPIGGGAHGLWWRPHLESHRGGELVWAQASLFARHNGAWTEAYQGPTERRWQAGFGDEAAQSAELSLEDVDGDGAAELLRREGAYLRRVNGQGQGVHVSLEGLGAWVHRRQGARFLLTELEAGGRRWRSRGGPPLVAVRAPEGRLRVDGRFEDWEAQEAANALALKLDSLSQIATRKRDRHGIEDFSGELALAYDAQALYLRAMVVDDKTRPCPPGARLYEGDHLVAWLDADLAGDFDEPKANGDDWGMGFGVGPWVGPGQTHVWMPRAVVGQARCAWAPLQDPHSGGQLGHQLEASIPWAMLGLEAPPLAPSPPEAVGPPPPGQVKHLRLRAQALMGLGLALADADDGPQEQAYTTAPGLVWARPTSLNPLVLAEAHLAPPPVVTTP